MNQKTAIKACDYLIGILLAFMFGLMFMNAMV